MSVSGIGSYDEDQWEVLLCRGSVGGGVSAEVDRDGSSRVRAQGNIDCEVGKKGGRISGGGSCAIGKDSRGNVTKEGKAEIRGDFPFWIKV